MAHFDGVSLILNENEMAEFRRSIMNPNREAIRKRDAFFAELDKMAITEHSDGSYEVDFEISDGTAEEKDVKTDMDSFVGKPTARVGKAAVSPQDMAYDLGEDILLAA